MVLTGLALIFSVAAFAGRLRAFNRLARPADRSPAKGSPNRGVAYAFTLGMAPWSKESTRIHFVAYLRGIAFHLGIFLGLGLLIFSPWMALLPSLARNVLAVCAGLGGLFGLIGFLARFVEPNLRALSVPDDYFAVLMVSLFLALTAIWLAVPAFAPAYYLGSALMLVYAPFSKIRHCIYYAYSRLFFGKFFGRRAVLPHQQQETSRAAR
jgi:hypothetical protein